MSSIDPEVSVVIPTYNHAHFLGKCLDSVIRQTYINWEVIVVNNSSVDNTVEVVEGFCDKRIRPVNVRNNCIIAASRNKGIELSRSPIIAFLDSDDVWYPEKLQRCLAELEKGADLVCHGMRYIKNGKHWKDVKCGPAKKADFQNLFYNGNCIIVSTVVVRKECLLKVSCFDENPDIVSAEDYDLWLRLSKEKCRFRFIDDILGEYHCHENSMSRRALRHLHAALTVINKHSSGEKPSFLHIFRLKRAKALFLYGAARSLQQEGKRKEALRFYLKGIVTFPFSPKIYTGILLTIFWGRPRSG